jgi:hypothetical protein
MSFNPNLLDKLIIVNKYGHLYLNSEELKKLWTNVFNEYCAFLGQNILYRRGKEFWEYHERGLRSIGYQLGWAKLFKYICVELANLLLNPKLTAGKLIRHFTRSR